jgi:ribose transport system substrate-binding protein
MPFSQAVAASLRTAAAAVGVDLLVLDNHYDAATAVANAETFIQERVDVVIEFQVEQHAAPIIADKIANAGIPLIAVDIPHPRDTGGVCDEPLGGLGGLDGGAGSGRGWAAGAEPHYGVV